MYEARQYQPSPHSNKMSTNANEVVSARVQTYSFDNGELTFSVDHKVIEDAITSELIDSLIGVALKTLIHRTTSRPKGQGEDATEWLLEALQGGAAAGRFRVTQADKDRAGNALKGHKMAPEQTEAQFKALYGIEFITDLDLLAKHYMNVRAAKAAAEKAAQSML